MLRVSENYQTFKGTEEGGTEYTSKNMETNIKRGLEHFSETDSGNDNIEVEPRTTLDTLQDTLFELNTEHNGNNTKDG